MPKTPSDCCFLVGNYVTELEGIISINSRTNFEASKVEGCIILGPSTGTVSVTAYADNKVYSGCNATASVSIPWIRKYDCDNDINYFIFQSGGMAQIAGNPADVSYLVGLNNSLFSTDYVSVSASYAFVAFTGSQTGIEIKGLSQVHIYTSKPFSDRSGDRCF